MSGGALSLPRRRGVPRPSGPSLLRLVPSARALVIAGASIAVAVGAYGLARETGMFAITRIDVQGAPPAVARKASRVLAGFRGTNLLALNGQAVLQRLEALPTVRSATYDRAFPHTLRVRIVPERAIAVLRRGPASWLVSDRGRVIASVDAARYPGLPRIWLPRTGQVEVGTILGPGDGGEAARALIGFGSFAAHVAWVRVSSGTLTASLRDGLELEFGDLFDVPLKIAIVERIVPTLRRPRDGGPIYLDVSLPDRPVAGTNPQPAG